MPDAILPPEAIEALPKAFRELLTNPDPKQLADLEAALRKEVANRVRESFKPTQKQKLFLDCGAADPVRIFRSGNQCLLGHSLIEHPDGSATPIAELAERGLPFPVLSWDGGKLVPAMATHAFRKDRDHPCWRLHLSNGQVVEGSEAHRLLTADNQWLPIGQIVRREYAPVLPQTTSAPGQSTRAEDGPRSTGTVQGYRDGCWPDRHPCGGPLHAEVDTGRASVPSQGDARTHTSPYDHSRTSARMDDLARTPERIHQHHGPGHLSISDGLRPSADLSVGYRDHGVSPCARSGMSILQSALRSSTVAASPLLAFGGDRPEEPENGSRHLSDSCAASSLQDAVEGHAAEEGGSGCLNRHQGSLRLPSQVLRSPTSHAASQSGLGSKSSHVALIGSDHPVYVVSAEYLGVQAVYDCTVPGFHNYRHGGVIHHNSGKSHVAAFEVAVHASGEYPDWWVGKRFDKPVSIWCISDTARTTRDIMQKKLFGEPMVREEYGVGCFLERRLLDTETMMFQQGTQNAIDSIRVKHVSGGWSRVQFKSYSSGIETMQGQQVSIIWIDEEPPAEIIGECLARLATTKGVMVITMTPKWGVTKVTKMFEADPPLGKLIAATLYDAHVDKGGWYTTEDIDRIVSLYPPHERRSRVEGVPFMGSGLVFPFQEAEYVEDDFQVPENWKQIGGFDLGIDHPAAFVRLAWNDPATGGDDVMHAIACVKLTDATPMMQAAAVLPWGKWLPWAYPHDANKRSVSNTGDNLETFKDMYVRHGMALLPMHAQNELGGNSLELSIAEMSERFQTGRLKIFRSCVHLLNEMQGYVRRDGVIQPFNDDCISALRYSVMMCKRFAVRPTAGAMRDWRSPVPLPRTDRRVRNVLAR